MLTQEEKRDYRWALLRQAIKQHLENDEDVQWIMSGQQMDFINDSINEFFDDEEIEKNIFFDDAT